jgi:hypothetical protein
MNGHKCLALIVKYTCLIVISIGHSSVHGQESLRSLIKCKHTGEAGSGDVQRVLVRSFPFLNFDSVEVPGQGASLFSVLAEKEAVSTGIQIFRYSRNEGDGDVNNLFFVGKASRVDMFCAILHIRGNQVTVFPRAMLVHPLIALAAVKPDDIVITMALETISLQKSTDRSNLKKLQELNAADPVHRWFYENFSNILEQETISIRVDGELLPPAMRGTRILKQVQASPSLFPSPLPANNTPPMNLANVVDGDAIPQNMKLEDLLKEIALSDILALSIVRRSVGPYTLRYVVPLKHAGAFRQDSQYYKKLFKVETGANPVNWSPHLDSFRLFPLVDGDVVEISTARSVPLFQQQGLLAPVN